MPFLPVSREELKERGIDRPDFICVTGDAYVDHPSFGIAIVSRVIESLGFSVAMLAQPVTDADFLSLGAPRYAFMVTGGNIDSMVSNYTVAGKKRNDDAYSPGGVGGRRPDRAVTVYCRALKRLFPDTEIAIGGLEASLRRFAHYDYWADRVLPSILVDSGAELLMYGMGELTVSEICLRLREGERLGEMADIRGTCYLTDPINTPLGAVQCDSFEMVRDNKKAYAKACRKQYDEQDEVYGRTIVQRHGDRMLVQNPPQRSLTQEEFDRAYELPYMRAYHPMYEKDGGVPSIREVEFSIIHNRGCYGFCNFCSIALHQGRRVQTRSERSVLAEAKMLAEKPDFKGYIHDVGGPTANFRAPSCKNQLDKGLCKGRKCLAPRPCPNLEVDHREYISLLRKLRETKRVKKVFIRSGIRYDYLLEDPDDTFLRELIEHHISGQLKVAPEHASDRVLDYMGKPHIDAYERFEKKFYSLTKKIGKEQYLVPYLMSSHPGCTLNDAVDLAVFLKKHKIRPEQVQDFYPTPGTISTAMFYTGLDPYTLEPVYVPRSAEEKRLQRALLQYYKKENRALVLRALTMTKRQELIGSAPDCLIAANDPSGRKAREYEKTTKNTSHESRHGRGRDPSQKSNVGKRGKKRP
ncbi:MAG: YgiQ family radical SAM protein [Bacteroides sp.]|nr:YgiQ family radical SAM protein [Eubacterium sp.]MCM1418276.1 YgiQ family radical SAM protein [Roseburia sp.]MCM1462341.1 YgiQ family radical SAM protein [Bacteroides sp.]